MPNQHTYPDSSTRFWSKVDRRGPDECWPWDSTTTSGYGNFWSGGRHIRAHRLSYELLVGPIPEGLQLDHLCRVRACVNPTHLEPVTQQENIRRGNAGYNGLRTHCFKGHEYTPENTYRPPKRPNRRSCRACHARQERIRKWGDLARIDGDTPDA